MTISDEYIYIYIYKQSIILIFIIRTYILSRERTLVTYDTGFLYKYIVFAWL